MPRAGRRTALGGSVALLLVGGVLLGSGLHDGAPDPAPAGAVAAPTAVGGPSAAPAAGVPAAGTAAHRAAGSTPSSPVHVVVPAVGVDLPVLPLTPRRGVIDPPLLTAAYWITGYGAPVGSPDQARNTLYLAAHSAGRGSAGFDPLAGDARGRGAVGPGDRIDVATATGTVSYTVQRTAEYDKDALPRASDVWQDVPGRLVLITCRYDGGRSTRNLVVFASS